MFIQLMSVQEAYVLLIWLAVRIHMICEADPLTLATYILALLRKQKSEYELRKFCVLQLYAFFREYTKAFVFKLFVVLKNRTYLDPGQVNDDVRDILAAGLIQPYTEAQFNAEFPDESKTHDSFKFNFTDEQMLRTRDLLHELASGPQHLRALINNSSRYCGVLSLSATENNNSGINAASGSSGVPSSSTAERSSPGSVQIRQGSSSFEAPVYVPTANKEVKNSAPSSSSNISSVVVDNGVKRERCSDYDKKGFCLRGNSCPYDHGSDPLVVNVDSGLGLNVPTSQVTSDTGFNMNFSSRPPLPSRPPPPLPPLPNSPPPPPSDFHLHEPYNPESPGMNLDLERKSYKDYKRTHASHSSASSVGKAVNYDSSFSSCKPQRARELTSVTISNNSSVGRSNNNLEKGAANDKKRKAFDFHGGPKKNPKVTYNKSALEVRKIPRHLNKMEFLIGHFRKFGTVIHIQIEYNDDPEAALVQYSKEEEAIAAYRCPEPVLDNRFIKVYFQKQKENVQTTKSGQSNDLSSASYSRASSSKPFHKPPTKGAYKYAHGKNVQRDKASALNKRWELYLKKLELFQGQMTNQRLIMNKLETCKKPAEREDLKKLMLDLTAKIKEMQEELKVESTRLKADFAAVNAPGSSKVNPIEEKECSENQNIQNSVEDAVNELEAQAKSLEIVDDAEASSGSHRRKSSVKEAVSSNGSCSLSTNKSPDPVCHLQYNLVVHLSGLTKKIDKKNLKKHFQEFGVVKNIDDALTDKIIITFAKPEEAEKAFLMGKQFNDVNLNLSLNHELSTSSASLSDTDLEREVPKLDLYDDDDDDEDEEESEARSWRH